MLAATEVTIQDLPRLDVDGAAWKADPWAEVRRLPDSDPRSGRLARSRRGVEVFSYDLFTSLMADRSLYPVDRDTWKEQGAGPRTLEFVDNGMLLGLDPERHLKVRRIMVTAFKMSHIEQRRGWLRN